MASSLLANSKPPTKQIAQPCHHSFFELLIVSRGVSSGYRDGFELTQMDLVYFGSGYIRPVYLNSSVQFSSGNLRNSPKQVDLISGTVQFRFSSLTGEPKSIQLKTTYVNACWR